MSQKGKLDPASVLDDDEPATCYSEYLRNVGTLASRSDYALTDNTRSHQLAWKVNNSQQFMHSSPNQAYSSLPDALYLQKSINCIPLRPSKTVSTSPEVVANVLALHMQLQNTIVSQRHMVRDCVKTKSFRRLKFFKKDVHGLHDLRNGTVCAMIVANCIVTMADADKVWWANMRKLVVCTHTDRRNNVIKNIRPRFCGKFG